MGKRTDLQTILEGLLGSRNVYFQPPESVKLKYPCIIYSRDYGETRFADNLPYNHQIRYKVTVIDSNPDSEILNKVVALPSCSFSRHYTADNLNHDVYNLYF